MKKSIFILVSILFFTQIYAQNYIQLVTGEVFCSKSININTDKITFSNVGVTITYNINDVKLVLLKNGENLYFNYDEAQSVNGISSLNEIRKNMNIFVQNHNSSLRNELSTMHTIIYLIKEKSFNVVYTPKEAHFIIEPIFDETGRDKIYFCIKEKNTDKILYLSRQIYTIHSFNPMSETEQSVNRLMENEFIIFKNTIKR